MLADPTRWPVVIVGAGAAGMVAAIFAARGGARVLLLDSRRVPGAKIRVSGGGRCNVLPSEVSLDDYHSSSSMKLVRNVLFSWPLPEVQRFFSEELAVPLTVEATGKVFPTSGRSKDVVDALLGELARVGVTLRPEARVVRIAAEQGGFALTLADDATLHCERVVVSTGGLSMPKTGSDGAGLAMLRRLGHTVTTLHPALVPLTTDDAAWHELAGVSVQARLTVERDGRVLDARHGDLLFTHTGFSGPVALDISRWLAGPGPQPRLLARFGSPALDWDAALRAPHKRLVATVVRDGLPRRLADALLARAAVPQARTTSELTREERARLLAALQAQELRVTGSEGYRTAEVTAGGVPLEECVAKTLESRVAPGLYLCGEVLDVTGRIGGFNFLWAWVSGRKVGQALALASPATSASA